MRSAGESLSQIALRILVTVEDAVVVGVVSRLKRVLRTYFVALHCVALDPIFRV